MEQHVGQVDSQMSASRSDKKTKRKSFVTADGLSIVTNSLYADGGNPSAAGTSSGDENANLSAVDKFRNSLIRDYNKDMRPFTDQKMPFSVAISMSMIHFDLVGLFKFLIQFY